MRRDYALMLDTVAELEHAQTAQFAGYASLPVLIAEYLNITRNDATRMVTQSELVAETVTPIGYTAPVKLPQVREALHEGKLDPKRVDAIARVVQQVPNWAIRTLLTEAEIPDIDTMTDVLLAPLAPELYRYQRHDRGRPRGSPRR
jgi:hypothetical protein